MRSSSRVWPTMTLRSSKKMRSTVSAVLASSIGVGGTSRLIGVVAAFGVSGDVVMVSCILLGCPDATHGVVRPW